MGGAPGAWRLHEEQFIGADVLALQEINMTPAEWNAFTLFVKSWAIPRIIKWAPVRYRVTMTAIDLVLLGWFATGLTMPSVKKSQ